MREYEEIKSYWDSINKVEHLGALSGCQYQETIDFLKVTDLLKKNDNVLEVGVGLGHVTKGFHENGYSISALDISQVALTRVREYCTQTYLVDDIDKLPTDYFNIIICHNGIQHIPTYLLKKELFHLIRSLTPQGVFAMEFISTNLTEDTGIDSEILDNLKWDANIGCYCRTPEYLEKMINECGGKCELVYDCRGDIAENITGCHIFHIRKT